MKKVEITVNGKVLPCRRTLGAALRFKKETGKEVTEIQPTSYSDVCAYLWCCIVSACKHDGIEFNLSLMEFADGISDDDMLEWTKAVNEEEEQYQDAEEVGDEGENEKKSH